MSLLDSVGFRSFGHGLLSGLLQVDAAIEYEYCFGVGYREFSSALQSNYRQMQSNYRQIQTTEIFAQRIDNIAAEHRSQGKNTDIKPLNSHAPSAAQLLANMKELSHDELYKFDPTGEKKGLLMKVTARLSGK